MCNGSRHVGVFVHKFLLNPTMKIREKRTPGYGNPNSEQHPLFGVYLPPHSNSHLWTCRLMFPGKLQAPAVTKPRICSWMFYRKVTNQ